MSSVKYKSTAWSLQAITRWLKHFFDHITQDRPSYVGQQSEVDVAATVDLHPLALPCQRFRGLCGHQVLPIEPLKVGR